MSLRLVFLLLTMVGTFASTPSHGETLSLPVPIKTIYPKSVVRAEDFTFKEYEVNDIAKRNFVVSLSQLEQQTAARSLPAGRPIPLRALKRTADIMKGQQAVARYVSEGIEIQGILVPEQDGLVGEVVKARNPETGVVLFARVASDGTLTVEEN